MSLDLDFSQEPIPKRLVFSPRRYDDVDESLRKYWEIPNRLGRPLPIRLTISLYDYRDKMWRGWKGLSWRSEILNFVDGKQWRQCLVLFFDLISIVGVANMLRFLRGIDQGIRQEQARKEAVIKEVGSEG